MERFKKALKSALASNSSKISIVEMQELELISDAGNTEKLLDLPPADAAWIDTVLSFLFKDEISSIDQGNPVQGALNIPGVGLLKAMALKSAQGRKLSLYFPGHGDSLFESDWAAANTPPEITKPAESSNEVMSAAENEVVRAPVDAAAEPVNDNLFATPPVEATPAEQTTQDSSSEDISNNMFSAQASAEEPSNMFAPATDALNEQPQAVAETPEQTEDLSANLFGTSAPDAEHSESVDSNDMFTPSMGATSAPEAANEESVAFTAPVAAPVATTLDQSQNFEPSTAHSAAPGNSTKEPKIIFGNNDPSKTIKREGSFPIDSLLQLMIQSGASDVHLTLGQPVIFRVDGDLVRQGEATLTEQTMESYLLPIMPSANKKEFAADYDTDFAYEVPGLARFRVNMFKDNYGVGAVLRQIPAEVLTAEQLGLPEAIRKMCQLHKGLVLVTGPTGSGKSTTLAAMIDLINKSRPDHILTIEDPIEFVHSQQKCLVNQREVGKHTNSFKRALKAALREDPDIVLIGELRDLETIHIALETAETGHLVFGTLHTNTAVSTIDRIIDQFPADQQSQIRTMVAASLKGVVAQTLIKKIGGGRAAAQEILVPNDAVANMIRESKNHMIENHMQTQKNDGNMLLNESLLLLVKEGKVDVKEAYYKSIDKASFADNARRAGVDVSFLNPQKPGTKHAS